MAEIFEAICGGNFEEVKRMVNEDSRCVHIKDYMQRTPLDYAILWKNLEMVQFLFEKSGQPNLKIYRNGEGTPVHGTRHDETPTLLKWVFKEKILPLSVLKIKDWKKLTPLDCAIANGRLETAKCLWKMGGPPNLEVYRDREHTPVHCAASNGRIETLKWIFTEGVLSLDVLNIKDWKKWTLLDEAIAHGKLETANYLWKMGGRPNLEQYSDGNETSVHNAAVYGDNAATLKWAFDNGVLSLDVLKIKNKWKKTPLDVAITCGNLEMAKCLWEMGGRPNLDIYNRDGENTPVHHAASRGYTDILKWAFDNGVLSLDVLKIKNSNGKTPMNQAIAAKQVKTADLLGHFFVDPVFLAMQRAKRDHYQCCVLRRLPDELLDMVVNKVAVRFHLEVVW